MTRLNSLRPPFGVSLLALLAAGSLLAASPSARADDETPNYAGDLWTREALTGDWGGARTKLLERGVKLDATYTGDASVNVDGGIKTGKGYTGLLQLGLTLDLEKLAGWTGGEIYAGAYFIRGHGLSTYEVGNLLAISNIESDHANRLGEVYFKQALFEDKVEIKIGQLAADGDFITSDTAGLFVNSTFGWPGLNGVNLPSGGPAYPVPNPGVHALIKFSDEWSFQAGLYNGDPAGHNVNPHNLDFPLHEGVFGIGELIYATESGIGGLPATYKAGAWFNTSKKFGDLRFANVTHDDDYAIYGVIDQTVWQGGGSKDLKDPSPSASSLSVFARAVIAPQENRNLINYYFDAGLNLKGFMPGRADDVFGVAAAYAHISDDAAKADRIAGSPARTSEIAIEASYKAAVTPWLAVQPFAQYIVRPGGGDPDPDRPLRRLKNATVLGFRTQVSF